MPHHRLVTLPGDAVQRLVVVTRGLPPTGFGALPGSVRLQVVVTGADVRTASTVHRLPGAASVEVWRRTRRLVSLVLACRGWSRASASVWNAEAAARVSWLAEQGALVVLDGPDMVRFAPPTGRSVLVLEGLHPERSTRSLPAAEPAVPHGTVVLARAELAEVLRAFEGV
jgi:hypothetical protein